MTIYQGVTINIPVGVVLTATKGEFFFKSSLTDSAYTCKKVKYFGNGAWGIIGSKEEIDFTPREKKEEDAE